MKNVFWIIKVFIFLEEQLVENMNRKKAYQKDYHLPGFYSEVNSNQRNSFLYTHMLFNSNNRDVKRGEWEFGKVFKTEEFFRALLYG